MAVTLDQTIAQRERSRLSEFVGSQTFWVLIAVILACLFLSVATDSFATAKNLYNITRNVTFVAIIALGMTLVIITGGIDLSVGSVLCLCSMVLAVTMHAGYGIEIGIAAAIGTALLVGAFNGVMIAYLDFPPFVVTLGMLSVARSLAMVASNNTVVFQFGPDHDKLLALGGGAWFLGIANPVLYMVILALLTGFVLRWTRFGRYIFAIGGNEHAATLTGVPVRSIKVAVYMISALSAGIAGIVQTGWLGAVTTNIGAGMELQVICRRCHRRRQLGRRRRHRLRRPGRRSADRGHPQQPRPARHQCLLAGDVYRRGDRAGGAVRPDSQSQAERVGPTTPLLTSRTSLLSASMSRRYRAQAGLPWPGGLQHFQSQRSAIKPRPCPQGRVSS